MRISQIGLAMHEIGRAREILGILIKYGFQDWVSKNGLGKYLVTRKRLARIEKYNQWERIRLAVEELGPTFIKFGQILADRPDILEEELRNELKKLQDEADPMPDDIAIAAIEKNLDCSITDIFSKFDKTRLASASMAQTYRATLLNGEEVCVKIQRPGIDKKINLDLNLMNYFAVRMQKNNPEMEAINAVGIVKEFGSSIKKELDFRHEAASVIRFRHNFENDADIYVPRIYTQFTGQRILVEEYVSGIKVSDMVSLNAAGFDTVLLSKNAVRLMFDQLFKHGFFHADPHPGNIFVMPGNVISFIDFGMMGSLRDEHLNFLGKYTLGYLERDAHGMTEALLLVSGKRHFARSLELEHQINELLAHYKYLSIDEMDFGKIMNESVDILVHYGLKMPAGIYLLAKALMAIERVAVVLNPEIDFASEMKPYATELISRQFDPRVIAREVFDSLKEYYRFVTELPADLNEIMSRIKEGRFKTQIELKGFEPLIEHMDTVGNRLAISIVLAALIIGASILSQWEQARLIGTAVFCLAGIFGFWLLVKLLRRNKF
ncbi:MAG: AarF/ABC1/UbiB kinase family protein [Bacteroidota bacterium]|jgi:ubiquinone biosynthesis protein